MCGTIGLKTQIDGFLRHVVHDFTLISIIENEYSSSKHLKTTEV
jgi:hypothetical protein